MDVDKKTAGHLRMLAQEEKWSVIRSAVAEAMNNTSTNPTPQAQFLATAAAKAGFEEGIAAALATFAMIRQFSNDAGELGKAFMDEMDRFLDEQV